MCFVCSAKWLKLGRQVGLLYRRIASWKGDFSTRSLAVARICRCLHSVFIYCGVPVGAATATIFVTLVSFLPGVLLQSRTLPSRSSLP